MSDLPAETANTHEENISSSLGTPDLRTAEPFERIFGYLLELFPLILLVLIPLLGPLFATGYLLFRDGIFPGQSFGKKVLKTQVVNQETGEPGSFRESVIRNLPLAINFFMPMVPVVGHILGGITGTIIFIVEAVSLFTDPKHRRLGDKLAGTIVVKRGS
jgi:uncharacterized RDD family membrane protein YckC